MVTMWRTRKNGLKWWKFGALLKMAENGEMCRSRKNNIFFLKCAALAEMA